MNMSNNPLAARLLLLTIFATLAVGCASLEHVTSLKEAQDAYTRTTQRGNRLALAHVLPADLDARTRDSAWALESGLDPDECARSATEYAFVARSLAALNERKAANLRADRLLGLSLSLQLLAEWKAAFFSHLLDAEARRDVDLEEPASLLALETRRDTALKVLDSDDSPVYARDRFLLEAMGPLVRFDNAYVHVIHAMRDGRLSPAPAEAPAEENALARREAERRDMEQLGAKIAEQMAVAESELTELVRRPGKRHLGIYVATARFTMLRTAIRLVLWLKLGGTWTWENGPHWNDWRPEEAQRHLPTLHARRARFLEDACAPDSALAGFLKATRIESRELPVLLPPFWARSPKPER